MLQGNQKGFGPRRQTPVFSGAASHLKTFQNRKGLKHHPDHTHRVLGVPRPLPGPSPGPRSLLQSLRAPHSLFIPAPQMTCSELPAVLMSFSLEPRPPLPPMSPFPEAACGPPCLLDRVGWGWGAGLGSAGARPGRVPRDEDGPPPPPFRLPPGPVCASLRGPAAR